MEGKPPPNALERALNHCQRGQLNEAETICRDVLRTDPRNFGGLHLLGLVKLQQGQPNEAIGWLEAAVKADSQSDAAFANYGMALASLERFNDALTSYERALAINPRNF